MGAIFEWLLQPLIDFFWSIFYYIEIAILYVVQLLYDLFEIFAGISRVRYFEEDGFLLDIFMSKTVIGNVYWGMAAIGVVLLFVFAGMAVVKKMFDVGEKVKESFGQILGNTLKGLLIIISMNFIITTTTSATALLIQQVGYNFATAGSHGDIQKITYGEEDYAAMARVLDTIGNYSLNPSYTSRYNVNECFNEIREDMLYLEDRHVFDIAYPDEQTWQKLLADIATSADLTEDVPLDVYDDDLGRTITAAMDAVRTNNTIAVLEQYEVPDAQLSNDGTEVRLDRILFLSGTLEAAKKDKYNGRDAHIYDELRGGYMTGQKDMYSWSQVLQDFRSSGITYFITGALSILIAFPLFGIVINSVARIMNILLLYVSAPPFIATLPLDGGAKFKQWTTSFIIQSFNIFGNIIAMYLVITVVPILFSSGLVIFDNGILNLTAKIIFLYGMVKAADKASGLFTGILSGHAAGASADAANAGGQFSYSQGLGAATTVGKVGAKLGLKAADKVVGGVASAVGLGGAYKRAKKMANYAGKYVKNRMKGMSSKQATRKAMSDIAEEQGMDIGDMMQNGAGDNTHGMFAQADGGVMGSDEDGFGGGHNQPFNLGGYGTYRGTGNMMYGTMNGYTAQQNNQQQPVVPPNNQQQPEGQVKKESQPETRKRSQSQTVPNLRRESQSVVQNQGQSQSVVQNQGQSQPLVQNQGQSQSVVQNQGQSQSVVQNQGQSQSVVQNQGQSQSVVQNEGQSQSVVQNESQPQDVEQNNPQSQSATRSRSKTQTTQVNQNFTLPKKPVQQEEPFLSNDDSSINN